MIFRNHYERLNDSDNRQTDTITSQPDSRSNDGLPSYSEAILQCPVSEGYQNTSSQSLGGYQRNTSEGYQQSILEGYQCSIQQSTDSEGYQLSSLGDRQQRISEDCQQNTLQSYEQIISDVSLQSTSEGYQQSILEGYQQNTTLGLEGSQQSISEGYQQCASDISQQNKLGQNTLGEQSLASWVHNTIYQ